MYKYNASIYIRFVGKIVSYNLIPYLLQTTQHLDKDFLEFYLEEDLRKKRIDVKSHMSTPRNTLSRAPAGDTVNNGLIQCIEPWLNVYIMIERR